MLAQTNTKGVPRNAVLIASAAGFLAVVANYFLGTKAVFNFLLNSSGATAVIVFLCIAMSQIMSRRRQNREGLALLRSGGGDSPTSPSWLSFRC